MSFTPWFTLRGSTIPAGGPTFCYFPPAAPSTRLGRIRIKKSRSQAEGKAL